MDITSNHTGHGGLLFLLLGIFLLWALVKTTGDWPQVHEINTWLNHARDDLGLSNPEQMWSDIQGAGHDAVRSIPELFKNVSA